MIRNRWFIVLVGLQVVFLIGMVLSGYLIERIGETVTLQTQALPKNEIIHDGTLTLHFEAEEIRPENWFMTEEPKSNELIYVLLTPNEQGIYQVKAASDKKMDANENEVIMRGRYSYHDQANNHIVRLANERYEIDTNTFSAQSPRPKFKVEIALSPWGQSKIVGLEEVE